MTNLLLLCIIKKNKPATRIMQRTDDYLGLGLTNLANLLNSEVIIIGEDISKLADILLKPTKEVVFSRA